MITRLSLHHFVEPEKPFREMQRVLKKGGKLVVRRVVVLGIARNRLNIRFGHVEILDSKEGHSFSVRCDGCGTT